jgi:hypothetical protein
MRRGERNMNIGIELVVSLLTSAVGIGVAYATIKTKIDHLEQNNDQYADKEYLLQLHKESIEEQKQLAERITHEQMVCMDMQKSMTTIREDYGTRIARIEEAKASSKLRIDEEQKKLTERIDQMQKSMTTIREDHGTRIARIEEAMVSIKHSSLY